MLLCTRIKHISERQQGTSGPYFLDLDSMRFIIMLSLCWIMLFICVFSKPNFLVTEQLLYPALMSPTFMGRGYTLHALFDGF